MLIHSDARQTIKTAAARAFPLEAGGLLLGWWDNDMVVVRAAIEVVDPAATGTSWIRHEGLAQRALDQAVAKFGHPWLGYIGDWHSHPAACDASQQDRQSIRIASLAYAQPLVLIVHRRDGIIDIHAARHGRPQTVSAESI
ncbi:Mov34/MPN/PAD-1 family protein [Actinoplanes sp. DH11]|uniref:Mov34/MPN/PAD-1 family protein n=1 Tax=Actinoplanes sp. DH11 TaxID=2857011 RepID=UPI001E2A822F|nr:Mov34/MPN/PAD-1 family protein [Actinoplanes sp. DH11]